MPIILAIEPDRRQASQLRRLTRACAAELVLADTTERALEAIGNRVPDLVLVPALLSPQDDAALATALRVIATAAHVQTLTTPIFAAPVTSSGGGVLSKWRRGRDQSTSGGCDPAVFAEQIAAYLAETAAAREQLAQDEEEEPQPEVAAPVADLATFEDPAPIADVVPIAFAAEPAAAEEVVAPAIEVVAEPELPAIEIVEEPVVVVDEPEQVWQPIVLETIAEPEPVLDTQPPPEERRAPSEWSVALSLTPLRWPRLEAMMPEYRSEPAVPPQVVQVEAPKPVDVKRFVRPQPVARPEVAPRLEAVAKPPKPETARPEWLDMLDALRRDIDRLRGEKAEAAAATTPRPVASRPAVQRPMQARPVAPPPVAPPAAAPRPAAPRPVAARPVAARPAAARTVAAPRPAAPRPVAPQPAPAPAASQPTNPEAEGARKAPKRKKSPPPIQDEWGFFDPQQCGFTALLAKLDEISNST